MLLGKLIATRTSSAYSYHKLKYTSNLYVYYSYWVVIDFVYTDVRLKYIISGYNYRL